MSQELERLYRLARQEASQGDMTIDAEVYARFERDPLDPLIGGGNLAARVGFFGRDPGRDEVRWMEPLIGAAGKLVRSGVHRWRYQTQPPDFDAERAMSAEVFFSNTVPYKPKGNKAWSVAVKRRFLPVIASYLVDHWKGDELITLGNVAFEWFALSQDREERMRLKSFWRLSDRYERSIRVVLQSPLTGDEKQIHLHPLPHPSPLNALWYPRFPALLDARLSKLSG